MSKKIYSDLITNKIIPNGYYDSTMDVYLSANDGDQAFYNDILLSINTAITFGAKKNDTYVPGINGDTIYSGTIDNPISKSIPITGTLQQIGELLWRQKQWVYKQRNDARIEVLNSEII
jgi:hypothetical protein